MREEPVHAKEKAARRRASDGHVWSPGRRSPGSGARRAATPFKSLPSPSFGGRYQLGRYLGRGASATVWEACHSETGVKVAVKVFDQGSGDVRQAAREAHVLSRVPHPNILQVFEVIESSLHAQMVCEHIDGESLRAFAQRMPQRRLDPGLARRLYRQVVRGISYCHDRLVIHRDVKLENLLLDRGGKRVKIVDFGFAAQVASNTATSRAFCGTPSYMAPELVRREPYSGFATDVWALGVVLFVLLCGTLPFVAPSEVQLYAKIRRGDFVCPEVLGDMPRRLIRACMTYDAAGRPDSAALLRHPWLLAVPDPDTAPCRLDSATSSGSTTPGSQSSGPVESQNSAAAGTRS